MEVREALMMTASQNNNPDNSYGYGIIDTWAAINFQFLAKTYSEKIFPASITVSKAYPNPFNPLVSLFIDSNIDKYFITSVIYDINGKFVESIFDGCKIFEWGISRNVCTLSSRILNILPLGSMFLHQHNALGLDKLVFKKLPLPQWPRRAPRLLYGLFCPALAALATSSVS